MRIGEFARAAGVSADTVRFYERAGLLPRPSRGANGYREYADPDIEHLRLLAELRRLDIPLDDAARIARWCHDGHCRETTRALPDLLAVKRTEIAERIAQLSRVDERLGALERHLRRRPLRMAASVACCEAAAAVEVGAAGCACCALEAPSARADEAGV